MLSSTEATGKPVVRLGDRLFSGTARLAAMLIMVALAGVAVFLVVEGLPGLSAPADIYRPADDFWSYVGPLVWGTVLAAVVALVIAIPFSVGLALFISHYAPPRIAGPIAYVIDLLAAIPSVVYGLWGGLALAHWMTPSINWLYDNLGFIPFFAGPPSVTGRTMLTAGIVLSIMVIPITTAISREVFAQTPRLHEEAAMALGATRWETIRLAVFPYAKSGVVSGVMLGLGRALGETMAVAMVLSATPVVTLNLISNSNPATIASNIAANYKEATPDRQSLLIATGLVLFIVTFVVNFIARLIVARSERNVTR
ncbi:MULTISPECIES: phosphate ABC transporter permease subunit PstC [unclassified Nocardioides]|uniref:phosphate ABC transporter permease subunit PstC n=1 Tax=Nocardioides sp. URHA0032 TaxID=1380388 RepID=UPI00048DA75C|nr:phosphate ABC transporter permease subunit PstC [Nocardioides sp. URHA0032]